MANCTFPYVPWPSFLMTWKRCFSRCCFRSPDVTFSPLTQPMLVSRMGRWVATLGGGTTARTGGPEARSLRCLITMLGAAQRQSHNTTLSIISQSILTPTHGHQGGSSTDYLSIELQYLTVFIYLNWQIRQENSVCKSVTQPLRSPFTVSARR